MLYVTDLDRTMIFSKRVVKDSKSGLCCVEYYNGKPISFMTYSALEKLRCIMENAPIIPATTRSISQLKRVDIFSTTEFAIADSGGTILHNGTIVDEWVDFLRQIVSVQDLQFVINTLNQLNCLTCAPCIIDNCMVFTKSDCKNISFVEKFLHHRLNMSKWRIYTQRHKIYVMPKEINKATALEYICQNLISYNPPIIASGDSVLDLDMLKYANIGIVPLDSQLATYTNYFITIGTGYTSNEDILNLVMKYI